ncbi:PorV/PorQ family protein [Caldithrix abyssi]
MLKKMAYVVLFTLLLTSVLTGSGYKRPGSTSAQFLKIGVSARAVAVGEAYTAVTQGADAFFYNPAALARIPSVDVFASYSSWFAGMNFQSLAVAKNFVRKGVGCLSFTSLQSDEMQVRTPLKPDGTGETFYVGNYRMGLSFARFLTNHAALGLGINYLHLKMWKYAVHSFSTDLGVLFITDYHGFRFGMSIVNFGPEIKFLKEQYAIPTNFSFGAAIEPIHTALHIMTLSFTTIKLTDAEQKVRVGAEYEYKRTFALRAGYKFGLDEEQWALGCGLKMNIAGFNLKMDYAFSSYGIIGYRNLLTLGLSF